MFERQIAAGMEWLDKERPGWWRLVDLAKLNLSESCRCVLGQVFKCEIDDSADSYINGFNVGLRLLEKTTTSIKSASEAGFDLNGYSHASNYRILDEEWIAAIRQRQQQVEPAKPPCRPAASQRAVTMCLR